MLAFKHFSEFRMFGGLRKLHSNEAILEIIRVEKCKIERACTNEILTLRPAKHEEEAKCLLLSISANSECLKDCESCRPKMMLN